MRARSHPRHGQTSDVLVHHHRPTLACAGLCHSPDRARSDRPGPAASACERGVTRQATARAEHRYRRSGRVIGAIAVAAHPGRARTSPPATTRWASLAHSRHRVASIPRAGGASRPYAHETVATREDRGVRPSYRGRLHGIWRTAESCRAPPVSGDLVRLSPGPRAPQQGSSLSAGPPPVEEIIAVMRAAGDGPEAMRLRGLIIVLWRAGLRISEALALTETDLDRQRGRDVPRGDPAPGHTAPTRACRRRDRLRIPARDRQHRDHPRGP